MAGSRVVPASVGNGALCKVGEKTFYFCNTRWTRRRKQATWREHRVLIRREERISRGLVVDLTASIWIIESHKDDHMHNWG